MIISLIFFLISHFVHFYFSKFINFFLFFDITSCWYICHWTFIKNKHVTCVPKLKLTETLQKYAIGYLQSVRYYKRFSKKSSAWRPNGVIQYSQILVLPNLIPRNCAVCFKTSCSGNPQGYYTYKHISMVFRSDPDPPY